MALNSSIKVPMPEHGAVKRRMGDKVYVYYATAVYRNKKGQPTSDRVSIGRYDEESGMLIPNRNYYEVYLKTDQPITKAIFDYGVYYAFAGIVKKLGIEKELKRFFPENWEEILTISQYMLSEGNVMAYIEDYCETHRTYCNAPISDAKCSKVFAEIRNEDIMLFLRSWMQKKKSGEYVAYDVTSISSYGKNTGELEWGYNRDKEKLPQINMGMYYGEESKLPLYYRIYPGSISDKTHLKYMVEDNSFVDGKRLRYVMDRGFYSADNLRFLTERGHRFIIALPGSLKYVKKLIKKHRSEIANMSENMLGRGLPYGKKYETQELGFRMNVHIYYDPQKALRESENLYELLEREENDLKGMEEPPDRSLHYDRYFFINRSKDGRLGYTRNHKAINEALAMCGFFVIAETDFKKTTAQILKLYRRRDVIEKSFDDLKNELDFKRARTHTSETLSGKIFAAFIALIVKSYIQSRISDTEITHKKLILELDKIKIFDAHTKANPRIINPLTKTVRDLLSKFEIGTDFVCDNSWGV